MLNLWDDQAAAASGGDPLQLRVYSSRLLGSDPDLVLHGGGNTSFKCEGRTLFSDRDRLLWVKGSGSDLATIGPSGFTAVRMEFLDRALRLDSMSDQDMVRLLRSAAVDPDAPAASVETLSHAVIPFRYVDHTHADAVVALTNSPGGESLLHRALGPKVLIVPYAMPGFRLAKQLLAATQGCDWDALEGIILSNHGVFTFGQDPRTSYEAMVRLVSRAEELIVSHARPSRTVGPTSNTPDLVALSDLRRAVSRLRGEPVVSALDTSPEAVTFASRADVAVLSCRGPLTPDHVIHTKPWPLVLGGDLAGSVEAFRRTYLDYFERYAVSGLVPLDASPRWVVWPGQGLVFFGRSAQEAGVVQDLIQHTVRAIGWSMAIGGWKPINEVDIFAIEYWDLEQAKLRRRSALPPLQGKVAIVTGAASGIGRACAEALRSNGASVVGLDLNPSVAAVLSGPDAAGTVCDVTDSAAVVAAVQGAVRRFGGLDILVSNAGVFPRSAEIRDMEDRAWAQSLDVNLSSHMKVIRACFPFLKRGIEPAIVVIGSKNVPAPGLGAAAYSAAKAGLTQLARVAALEFGRDGIRVNVIHPNAVFDTGIWTREVLADRASRYGMTVEQYMKNNVLGVDITAKNVAELACAMAGRLFSRTTGAQVSVDGGNDRVI